MGERYILSIVAICLLMSSLTMGAHLAVNTSRIVSRTDAEYLSVNLDFGMITVPPGQGRWATFDFKSPRVRTLLRGLAPCYLRFGGTTADMTVFSNLPPHVLYNLETDQKLYTIYDTDIDNLVGLTSACGCRLLFDLNLNVRYYKDWDPTNALRLLDFMVSRGYAENVDFELGNEPDASPAGLSGQQIGKDFLLLKHLLKEMKNFNSSKLVGADIVTTGGLSSLMPEFLAVAGRNLSATTFHHYYFNGLGAHPSEFINPVHFDSLKDNINLVKRLIQENSDNKQLPVWIGETADAWHSGTENVTDRYISGFLWLDKLGLAAQLGVHVVMRQTFYGGFYGLINNTLYPSPDYWVSFVHHELVGHTVFNTTVTNASWLYFKRWRPLLEENRTKPKSTKTLLVRLYAQCTKPSSKYSPGALTVFGINLMNNTEELTFDVPLANQRVDQYILTPYGADGLLSKEIALNNQPLRLVNDITLPSLSPLKTMASAGLKFPGLSFGFWVFPDANVPNCRI